MKKNILVSVLIVILLFAGFGGQVAGADGEPVHPRLYFSQEDLIDLRALQTAPSHQAIWNNIRSWADAHIGDPPPAEPTGQSWRTWFDTAADIRRHIETMAFMYAMTEDAAYAEAAKGWMLSISGWSAWGTGNIWAITQHSSPIILGFCFGYDGLHDYLTSLERDAIRQAIITHTDFIDQTGYRPEDYPNSIAIPAGVVGIAALTLLDEYGGSSSWLGHAIADTRLFLGLGGNDGGSFEGLSYAPYSMDALMPFLDALKRVTGQNLFAGNDFLENHPYYYIYLTYNGRPLQFEDCNWLEGYRSEWLPFMYRLASEYDDGYAQWFAESYASQSLMQSFIWKNPDVVALPPASLPLTWHFNDTGYVVTKSGWGSDDLLFAFKSGSSRGHAHNSQNEFGIYYKGKPITCGPGYVCLYITDDTWPHNCILVDGLGQCREPGDYQSCPLGTRGRILAVDERESNYVYILGDASAVYTGWSGTSMGRTYTVGDLDLWHRHAVFMKNPNYFAIFDRLEAASPKRFELVLNLPLMQWHGAVPQISVDGDLITLDQPYQGGAQLHTLVVEPEGFSYEIIPYEQVDWDFGQANQIRVSNPAETATAQFLTVLYPDAVLPLDEVKAGNLLGVIITYDNKKDLVLFSTDGNHVDQYIELGGQYQAVDGESYMFEGTGVRGQFDRYQVMRLERQTGTNHAPVLDAIGNKTVDEGQLLEFSITATDPDGDSLTYSASNIPEGADFDPATQTFNWTPTDTQAGTYPDVHFEVTDGDLTGAEDITITVNDAEAMPPVIFFIPPTDDDGAVVDRDWTEVSVSVDSSYDTSSFIDWDRSLVGYWNFNENSGQTAYDKSSYNNEATLRNGPQWTTGKFGSALRFDGGDSYVDCESSDFDLTNEATLEAWFYIDDWTGENYQEIYMGGDWKVFMDIANSSQKIRAGFAVHGTTEQTPSVSVTSGEWHHAVAVYDGASVTLYLDGSLASQDTDIATPNGDIDNFGSYPGLHIGKHRQTSLYYLNGLIDEVRIWNRALSAEEIKASYNTRIYSLSQTFTSLADGTYQYYAYATDTSGNSAQTETRTLTVETTPITYPPGDANKDGSVNSLDITKLKRIIMGLDDPTSEADANEDGRINSMDITKIELIIMGG